MKLKRELAAAVLAGAMLLSLPGCSASAATLAGKAPAMPTENYYDITLDAALLDALSDFSARSGEAVLAEGENLCYSPVSLYYALALAGTGAAGETQQEIYTVLGAADTETLSDRLQELYCALYRDEDRCKVYLANSVWMRDGVTFYDTFTDNAAEKFYAESYTMDFDASGAGRAITDWVSDKTKGLLKPEIELSPETIAILLNALYFKANWSDEFQTKATAKDTFTLADGSTVQCDFMHATRDGTSVAAEGYTMASLYFQGSCQMFFLLPDEGETIDGLLENRGLAALLDESAAEYLEVEWSVPKFTARSEMDLIPALESLGVRLAFSNTEADFSAMADVSQLPGKIAYISGVKQGTYFSIDEEGAEAAAYTELDADTSAAPPDETIVMDLNRPFLYGIRDYKGAILFLGRCDNPAA